MKPVRSARWNPMVTKAFREQPLFVHRQTSRVRRVTRYHQQPGIELHFTHSGRGTFHLHDCAHVQLERQVIVLNGLVPHQVYADDTRDYVRTVLCLDLPLLTSLTSLDADFSWETLLPQKDFYRVFPTNQTWQELEATVIQIHREYCQRDDAWKVSALGSLLQLFATLKRSLSQQHPIAHDPIAQCLEYIDLHLDKDLTLETLAEIVHFSPKYLSQLFTRTVGCGLRDYIRIKRIDHARNLLVDRPSLTIAGVAFRCGFKTIAHFSRVFTTIVGVPPSIYRSRMLNSRHL